DSYMFHWQTECRYSSHSLEGMEFIDRYIFNHEEYIRYNSTLNKFIGYTERGVYNASALTMIPVCWRMQADLEGVCKQNAKLCYESVLDMSDPSMSGSDQKKVIIGASAIVLGLVIAFAGLIYYKRNPPTTDITEHRRSVALKGLPHYLREHTPLLKTCLLGLLLTDGLIWAGTQLREAWVLGTQYRQAANYVGGVVMGTNSASHGNEAAGYGRIYAFDQLRDRSGLTSDVASSRGGSGIGRAVCQRFAQEGASVVIADINEVSANETLKLLSHNNEDHKHSAFIVDVTSKRSVEQLFSQIQITEMLQSIKIEYKYGFYPSFQYQIRLIQFMGAEN
ncbi:DHB8 dehydrogenase, partial [Polypterus senegalus]